MMKRISSLIACCAIIGQTLTGCTRWDQALVWMEGDGSYVDFGNEPADSDGMGNQTGYFVGQLDAKEVAMVPEKVVNSEVPSYQPQAIPPNFFSYSATSGTRFVSGKSGGTIKFNDMTQGPGEDSVNIVAPADFWAGTSYGLEFPYRYGTSVSFNSFFGWRNRGKLEFHNGVDLQGQPRGDVNSTKLYASGKGEVVLILKNHAAVGNTIMINYHNVDIRTDYGVRAEELFDLSTEGKIFSQDPVALKNLENALGNAEEANIRGQTVVLQLELEDMFEEFKEFCDAADPAIWGKLTPGIAAMILDFCLFHNPSPDEPRSSRTASSKMTAGCQSTYSFVKDFTALESNLGENVLNSVYDIIFNHITDPGGDGKMGALSIQSYQKRLKDAYDLYGNTAFTSTLSNKSEFVTEMITVARKGIVTKDGNTDTENRPRYLNTASAKVYRLPVTVFGFMEVMGRGRISDMLSEISALMKNKTSAAQDSSETITLVYEHLSTILVTEGQIVDSKTQIGVEGSTGDSTGTHLHLTMAKGAIRAMTDIWKKPLLDGYCVMDPMRYAFGIIRRGQGLNSIGMNIVGTITNSNKPNLTAVATLYNDTTKTGIIDPDTGKYYNYATTVLQGLTGTDESRAEKLMIMNRNWGANVEEFYLDVDDPGIAVTVEEDSE